MFYDPLQARLREMEKGEASLNRHKKSLSDIIADRWEFLKRYRGREVEEVPQQTAHYASPKVMAADIRQLFKDTASERGLGRYALMQILYTVKLAEDAWPRETVEERIEIARCWSGGGKRLDERGMALLEELIDWDLREG